MEETRWKRLWQDLGLNSCMYLLVPLMETAQNLHTTINSSMVWNGMKYVILVHTSMYWYILVCTCFIVVCTRIWISVLVCNVTYCVCISLSKCKQVQTSTNKYKQVQTSTNMYKHVQTSTNLLILLYTAIYLYVLVCTGTKRIAKECITIGFEPMTSCILSSWSNRFARSVIPSVLLFIFAGYIYMLVSIAAVRHLAAGVGHPARAPPPWRHAGHGTPARAPAWTPRFHWCPG
jgi:hypothetical protein